MGVEGPSLGPIPDYRQDRRDSNLDVFDQRTHAFYVQAGIGFFSEALRR